MRNERMAWVWRGIALLACWAATAGAGSCFAGEDALATPEAPSAKAAPEKGASPTTGPSAMPATAPAHHHPQSMIETQIVHSLDFETIAIGETHLAQGRREQLQADLKQAHAEVDALMLQMDNKGSDNESIQKLCDITNNVNLKIQSGLEPADARTLQMALIMIQRQVDRLQRQQPAPDLQLTPLKLSPEQTDQIDQLLQAHQQQLADAMQTHGADRGDLNAALYSIALQTRQKIADVLTPGQLRAWDHS